MRFYRALRAELACAFVLTTLALAAALAQSNSAVSYNDAIYETTIDPRANAQAASPAFTAELVRFLRPLERCAFRFTPIQRS